MALAQALNPFLNDGLIEIELFQLFQLFINKFNNLSDNASDN